MAHKTFKEIREKVDSLKVSHGDYTDLRAVALRRGDQEEAARYYRILHDITVRRDELLWILGEDN